MVRQKQLAWRLISVAVACGALFVVVLDGTVARLGVVRAVAQEAPAPGEDDYEVLAAGAVHEAFAEPISYDPEPGKFVEKEPPEAIEELPPETQPEGDNIVWIPGYWNWDEDRDNFVWLSGFWRDVPPGREWVPGYWTKADDGWQWVAGYWASNEEEEVSYLPNPPTTLEIGPATPAPSTNHIWVPGCWMWRDVRYAWRPGYWIVTRPDWVWVPAHYVWTPGGFIFVNGYWDMPVARRGILFAPIFFRSPVYARPAYRYSPSVVVNLSLFTSHLWVRPRWGCYYFGDYYAARYSNRGFYPWHTFHSGHHGYDPIFVQNYHQHVHIEKNREWTNHLQRDFTRHVEQVDSRPPRSFSKLAVAGAAGGASVENMGLVTSLKQASTASDSPMKFRKIDEGKREEFVKHSKETRVYTKEREKQEKIAGEGRPIPPRKGRPDRNGDGEKVVKGATPKLEGPKAVVGKGGDVVAPKPDGEKPSGEKPSADTTVRKVGRTRSPVGDKSDPTATAKRGVPPRLDLPGAGAPEPSAKTGEPKIDPPGRDKVGGSPGKRGKKPDMDGDDDKPGKKPSFDSPKTKPRDLPRGETPKGSPKVDPPKTSPKFDPPKTTPKFDPPKNIPKVDPPKTTPKFAPPKTTPKFDPPKTKPRGEAPKNDPPRTSPKVTPKPESPRPKSGGNNPPRNDPPKKGRNEKKDRAATAGSFEGNATNSARSGARVVDTQPPSRNVRSEPRSEPRVDLSVVRAGASGNNSKASRGGKRNDKPNEDNNATDERRRDRGRP